MNIVRVAAGVALVSLVACSDGPAPTHSTGAGNVQTDGYGSLNFELLLPDGTSISSVGYTVSGGPSNVDRSGTIDVSNSTTLSFRIGNLPVGDGYTMKLTATTADGVSCGGTAMFAVANNEVSMLSMDLICGGGAGGGGGGSFDVDSNGDVSVTVSVLKDGGTAASGSCPLVSGISALPLEVTVPHSLSLEGFATSTTDVTYAWSGGTGMFSAASAAATQYTCTAAGPQTLTFTVSKTGCDAKSKDLTVTCTGGSGVVVDSGTGGGSGEDSGSAVVDSGSAVVDSGSEVVDSGSAVVDSGSAVADSGTGTVDSGTGGGGGGSWPVGSAACGACQMANCTNYFDENPYGACTDSLCQQVMACTYEKKCFSNLMNIPDCYCGTGNTVSVCQVPDFVPTGACKDIISQGLETTVNMTVLERYINPVYAAGRAGQLATCISDLCITECGLGG